MKLFLFVVGVAGFTILACAVYIKDSINRDREKMKNDKNWIGYWIEW